MTNAATIRPANPDDRQVVLRFHHELYINHRDEIAAPDTIPLFAYRDLDAALRDDVDALLHGRSTVVLLAERDGQPVGYVSGHVETDERRVLARKGVVEDWFVKKSERGHGTGKRLLDTLLKIFREDGCVVAESQTWAFNDHARAAHKLAGFTEIEVRMRRRL
jgi:GNAT superfamily N-acetyltransferase